MDELFPAALPLPPRPDYLLHSLVNMKPSEVKGPGTILTVRGCSGAGKSHLARSIMSCYDGSLPVFEEGRRNPLYYFYDKSFHSTLVTLGSYESDCGGCDTITGTARIYELVKAHALAGRDVFFEGLMLSADIIHTEAMGLKNHILYLDTSLEDCLASVNARRRSKGKMDDVNPENITAKSKGVRKSYERAKSELSNAEVYWVSREEAFLKAKKILGL